MLRRLLDPYEQRARLAPGMIAALPGVLLLGAVLWSVDAKGLAAAAGLAMELGVPIAISNHTRRAGKRLEDDLWRGWGGPPTTRKLRHRSAENQHRLALAHASLGRLAPQVRLPGADEELNDPAEADGRYEAAAEVARNRLRHITEGKLLFAENCSYGYHRNLLALRPLGLRCAGLALAAACLLVIGRWLGLLAVPVVGVLAVLPVEILLLVFWVKAVRAESVERAADSYAETFIGALAALPPWVCGSSPAPP